MTLAAFVLVSQNIAPQLLISSDTTSGPWVWVDQILQRIRYGSALPHMRMFMFCLELMCDTRVDRHGKKTVSGWVSIALVLMFVNSLVGVGRGLSNGNYERWN